MEQEDSVEINVLSNTAIRIQQTDDIIARLHEMTKNLSSAEWFGEDNDDDRKERD